jgi:hypothetical protein
MMSDPSGSSGVRCFALVSSGTTVYLEVGRSRTFACAVEWPGWCRAAPGEEAALQALLDYAPRYARVAGRAGMRLHQVEPLTVVETVAGTTTTDLGAPDVITEADRRPLDRAGAGRIVALLDAGWEELAAVAAGAPAALRKGPRGGGRDRDAIVDHVVEAERSYARKLGVRLTAAEWRDGHVTLLRERLREALLGAAGTPVETGWPPRYLARRTAWHVLDHAWEIEDRSR